MRYIRVRWLHASPDDPIELYSELDEDGWEVRKVEVFRDGKMGLASATEALETSELGLAPVPALEEIARDPQFRPEKIRQEEFEHVWKSARHSASLKVR